MKRRDAVFALGAAAVVTLALLTVFAIELSNTQANSKRDVSARVHERGVLAAALIDSLFQTVQQQIPQYARLYGAAVVPGATLEKQRQTSDYLALLDARGAVISHSQGFTPQAAANLSGSGALALVRSGVLYGLGNLNAYGNAGAIDFAVSFPTKFGVRTLLTAFAPNTLAAFIGGELRKIPGVKGANNYLIDGNRAVIASTDPRIQAGQRLSGSGQVAALKHPSADVGGHFYDQVTISNSTWRLVLVAPDGPLFASVSGFRKWIPWAIFAAFALFALAALGLGRRVLRAADKVREASRRVAAVNAELETTNAKLERRAAELARSNSELEQFASIASHDLQEPLRKVRTFTQRVTVTEAGNMTDKGRDYLDRANAAAERMQRLIEDLLKFSRVSTHGRPFVPVDLDRLTREVLVDLEHQIERSGATVHTGALPTINGDELQLRQLLQNLISNALKFHRDGIPPEVGIEAAVRGGSVSLVVRDNGIGFEQQYSRRIFRVFERLHSRGEYPGTGIGLALCRKIAERHGGTVTAEGDPGVGSTFTVKLRIDQSEEIVTSGVHATDHQLLDLEESHVPA